MPTRGTDPLDAVLDALPAFDGSIVQLLYGSHTTFAQAAQQLATTPERVATTLMGVYRTVARALEHPERATSARELR